ncbi:hypothetical protein ES703_60589 [subsurface metagenome]
MCYSWKAVQRHFAGMSTADWNNFVAKLQKLGLKKLYTKKEFQELLLREQGTLILKDMLDG